MERTKRTSRFGEALRNAGFTPASFAKEYDLSVTTIRSHANGWRPVKDRAAKQYARLLQAKDPGITWFWLASIELPQQDAASKNGTHVQPLDAASLAQVAVPEYDARLKTKGAFQISDATRRGSWGFSRRYLADELHLPVENLAVFEVVGDSMGPTLVGGDRVLVNMSDRTPSPPGIFVLMEGGRPVARRLDSVIGSKPMKLLRLSDNKSHPPQEIPAHEAEIVGRVVWFARRI